MKTAPLALLGTVALVLAGCAVQPGEQPVEGIRIVASTDVYGDIARTIAGDRATVTSIIEGTGQDPHSYEATARDRLAVSEADLVIENGGGYDYFMQDLLAGSGVVVITVSDLAESAGHDDSDEHDDAEEDDGHGHEGHGHIEGFNEHVWYDLHVIEAFAHELAHELAELDGDGAAQYEANLAGFEGGLDALLDTVHELRHGFQGRGAFATEPVPGYLLGELGFADLTPEAYVSAVEGGVDVAPAVLFDALRVVESGDVALLVYNEQTTGPQIEQVVSAAKQHGVPVVTMTETLPAGMHYLDWMESNVSAVSAALGAGGS